VPGYVIEGVVVIQLTPFDVEEPLVHPMGVMADPEAGVDHRVVHGDERPRGLDGHERPDGLRRLQAGHAEVGLAEHHVVLGSQDHVGGGGLRLHGKYLARLRRPKPVRPGADVR
jgi:hypothetical protein